MRADSIFQRYSEGHKSQLSAEASYLDWNTMGVQISESAWCHSQTRQETFWQMV